MQLIYEKLPKDISERHVLLLDPVLATGNKFLFTSNFAIVCFVLKSQVYVPIALLFFVLIGWFGSDLFTSIFYFLSFFLPPHYSGFSMNIVDSAENCFYFIGIWFHVRTENLL